ncbi:MAG: phosphatase PAP2 family protein [Micromonosporaceae bacterium]|nr:phosphatase PAP2 family protein [Micromonosporaceae bacterium]
MRRGSRQATVAWLGTLWLANVVLFAAVARVSVRSIRGQMLDTVALYGNSFGRRTLDEPLDAALNAVSTASVGLILVAILVVALARRRLALAVMSAAIVVGASASTYVLKRVIDRPFLGVDLDRAYAGNSLPSGHATAAAAFAIGLTLVLPPRARGAVSLIGATYAAVVGVATLSSGWHRPSDVVAAYLVVGGWTAAASLVLVLTQPPTAVVVRAERAGWSLVTSSALGTCLVAMGLAVELFIAQRMTDPVEQMAPAMLRLGYVGSVLVVAGAAYLMMAVVLFSVHRVVPHDPGRAVPIGLAGRGGSAPLPVTRPPDPTG